MIKTKTKKCKFSKCRKSFAPFTSLQQVCPGSIKCALGYAEEKKAKKFKTETRVMRNKFLAKDRKHQFKLATGSFSPFIRLRDADLPCISCGRTNIEVLPTDGWKVGGAWDCGHFLAVGSHPELRFEELNAHKQCKSCNGGSGRFTRKNHTVSQEYQERLIDRIGLADVEWLKGPHESKHYTVDDFIEIKIQYRQKLKVLQQERAA